MLVVLSMLAAIAYPSYRESVRKARRAEGRAALLQVMHQQERYYLQHNTYVAFTSSAAHGFTWHSGASPRTSAYEISAAACDGQTLGDCVLLTAQPGTQQVNPAHRDDECRALSLTSSGRQAASGSGASCW